MNKKSIIGLIIALVLFSIVSYYLYTNRTVATVTLDINPSVKIELKSNNKVKRVIALNEDAKTVIKNIDKSSLESTIETITRNVFEEGYVKDDRVMILINKTGDISLEEIKNNLEQKLDEEQLYIEIMVIENVTEQDLELAKQNNITPAKASYINSIKEKYESIDETLLTDKSINELNEIKETGLTCETEYTLHGNECKKEMSRKPAQIGTVCPYGYYEQDGTCFEEVSQIETGVISCNEGGILENNQCRRMITREADNNFTCQKGSLVERGRAEFRDLRDSGDPNQMVCEDKEGAVAPTLRCLYNSGHIMIDGKCYNGPAPLINGGCPGQDLVVNGSCYSLDDEDQWQCPNGDIYEYSKGSMVELCPDTFKYTSASGSYYCNDDEILQGNKCIKYDYEEIIKERICPSGYTQLENGRCVNYNNSVELSDGYRCDDQRAVVENSSCVVYDIKEPIQN